MALAKHGKAAKKPKRYEPKRPKYIRHTLKSDKAALAEAKKEYKALLKREEQQRKGGRPKGSKTKTSEELLDV